VTALLDPPLTAPSALDLSPLTTARTLLVALDFDGVVAPLQDDPAASRPLPRSAEAVAQLAALPDTPVGYISGRSMEVLQDLSAAPDSVLFIGSHGLETDFSALPPAPDSVETPAAGAPGWSTPLTAAEAALLDELDAGFRSIAAGTPAEGHGELRIEPKPLGRTAHTRGVSENRADYFHAELAVLAARLTGLRSFAGHAMTEFAVRMETKGDGLARMIAATRADAVLFLGDDAFAHLNERTGLVGLGVKVGEQATSAPHRIADPEAVADLLTRLAAERRAALGRDRGLGDGV
jgi:trehalose-6-phosphatase